MKYRATLAQNERAYRTHDFESASDETATQFLKENWEKIDWSQPGDFDEIDARDTILMLDSLDVPRGQLPRVIHDEIDIDKDRPYSQGAIEFVKMVARFTTYDFGDADDDQLEGCVATMNRLIYEAKNLLSE